MNKFRFILPLLFLTLLILTTCKQDDDGLPLTCTIGVIQDNMEIKKGTLITFPIYAVDPDGSVSSVVVFIDGEAKDTANIDPYIFSWSTSNVSTGSHEITATATNPEGETATHTIEVNVITGGTITPCPEAITISYAGQTYNTVKIGEQCWLKENLNLTTDDSRYYNDNPDNGSEYGQLYTWQEANEVCPPGWHLPTDDDWCTLVQHVDNSAACEQDAELGTDAGFKLKSEEGWLEAQNGSDQFGFMALPGGYASDAKLFEGKGSAAIFWSATEGTGGFGTYWSINSQTTKILTSRTAKGGVLSVRCIKD